MSGTEFLQFALGGFAVGVGFGMLVRGLVEFIAKAIDQ
jgi:hypothetical protein